MTDEGRCFSATNGEANSRVYKIGKGRDGVLEPVPRDLHDPSAVLRDISALTTYRLEFNHLYDGNLELEKTLGGTVHKAVF